MMHPLAALAKTTPGIIESWIRELLEPTDQSKPFNGAGRLVADHPPCAIGSL